MCRHTVAEDEEVNMQNKGSERQDDGHSHSSDVTFRSFFVFLLQQPQSLIREGAREGGLMMMMSGAMIKRIEQSCEAASRFIPFVFRSADSSSRSNNVCC